MSIGKPIGLGGFNFSGDVFTGVIFGSLAGQTTNVNVSAGPLSITVPFDSTNPFHLIGATLGTGQTYLGFGVSVTESTTFINRPSPNPIEDLSGFPMALVPLAHAGTLDGPPTPPRLGTRK